MLIRELKRHFPARLPEWWNAGTLFVWGAYILLHPGIFDDHIFDGLIAVAYTWASASTVAEAERVWGLVAVTVGLVRMGALFVNGSYSRTPLIRLATSAISAFVWCQVVIGLIAINIPTTGVVMYSAAVVLDLISAYRASWDAAIAESARRSGRGDENRVISAGYFEVRT